MPELPTLHRQVRRANGASRLDSRRILALAFVSLVVCAIGCTALHAQHGPRRVVEKPTSPNGIIFVLGGVGGYDPMPFTAQFFLPKVGVIHEIRDFRWTHGLFQILKDLQDTRYLRKKANELAKKIMEEKRRHPNRPIYLLGNSGGTGLALFTAERLPPGTIERIVLTAAAVSPNYDLRRALLATRKGIVSFHSHLDRFILGWGTWQFGTVDRKYVAAAGCEGFVVPKRLSPSDKLLYRRLVQIPWQPRMLLLGHSGTHTGCHAPGFLMSEIAPWLRD